MGCARNEMANTILKMAEDAGVAYTQTALDAFAHDITRLAGDDIELDDIELTILALHRAGHIDGGEMMRLQDSYLREGNANVRSFW